MLPVLLHISCITEFFIHFHSLSLWNMVMTITVYQTPGRLILGLFVFSSAGKQIKSWLQTNNQ